MAPEPLVVGPESKTVGVWVLIPAVIPRTRRVEAVWIAYATEDSPLDRPPSIKKSRSEVSPLQANQPGILHSFPYVWVLAVFSPFFNQSLFFNRTHRLP